MQKISLIRQLLSVGALVWCGLGISHAATTDLASSPLATSSTTVVRPNLIYILDDSGSMGWDYLPDYVNDGGPGYCRGAGATPQACVAGDPPWYSNAFNGVFYNPAITYAPPLNADGTSKQSYNTSALWQAVKVDGYNIQSTSSINLLNGFPERKWCNSTGLTTCVSAIDASSNYTAPNATYKYLKTVYGTPFYYVTTVQWCNSQDAVGFGTGTCQSKKTSTYKYVKYGTFARTDIVSTTSSYTKAASRSDCTGSTCTYAEEMTNFANWYAYYRTRMQTMKTGVSHAFATVTDSFRVGYMSINNNTGSDFINFANFDSTQKTSWYAKLFAASPGNSTPLRSALSTAGLLYGNKLTGATFNGSTVVDPMQYECQQSFAILSTDGYWNTGNDSGCSSRGGAGCQLNKTSAVGNQDGSAARPFYDGSTSVSTTTTKYTTEAYSSSGCSGSKTKITSATTTTTRTVTTTPDGGVISDVTSGPTTGAASTIVGCTSSPRALQVPNPSTPVTTTTTSSSGGSTDSLADVAMYYYQTDLRSDLSDNVPTTDKDNNPKQHMTTFTLGLGVDGTLTYTPDYESATAGDYASIKGGSRNWPVPSADTQEAVDDLWHAAVNGRGIYFSARDPNSLSQGLLGSLAGITARAGASAASATSSPNITETDNYIYSSTYRTVYWDGEIVADTIDTQTGAVSTSHVWSAQANLDAKVGSSSDSRTIYHFDPLVGGKLELFQWSTLDPTEQGYLSNKCTVLSQCGGLVTAAQTLANDGQQLLAFLRGQTGNEGGTTQTDKPFRDRQHVLGDTVNATPAYVKVPRFNFTDNVTPDYPSFKSANTTRQGMLYIAGNDGMLHALNADTGNEVWAYIPTVVMPDLYRLADKNYSANHRFYVDGSPQVMDIFDGAAWRTILVGGLNGGGRGYYALDVTTPTTPKALWEFCASGCTNIDSDLGYTYGNPVIGKLPAGNANAGKWVVMVTSGYNNVSPGSGKGYLYVLNALSGVVMDKIATTAGDGTTPSGLAKISGWAENGDIDATVTQVYGGDLQGNLWRFNLDSSPASVMKMATLVDGTNTPQPITSKPELGKVPGVTEHVVFVGTGRYLGVGDLASTQTQSIYAIRDTGATLANPRSLSQRTITHSGITASIAGGAINWGSGGWFADFPDAGERVNIDPQLVMGNLLVATNIPSGSACSVGGSSWIYQFDYSSGLAIASSTTTPFGQKSQAGITVGIVVFRLPSGQLKAVVTDAGGGKTTGGVQTNPGSTQLRRAGWRELVK